MSDTFSQRPIDVARKKADAARRRRINRRMACLLFGIGTFIGGFLFVAVSVLRILWRLAWT